MKEAVPELEALRLLLEQCRHMVVSRGQVAFVNVDAHEARRQADRLDRLEEAELALDAFQKALEAFPEILTPQQTSPTTPREIKNASVIDAENFGLEVTISSSVAKASGYWDGHLFTMSPGSQMRVEEVPSIHPWIHEHRSDLIKAGIVEKLGNHWVFKESARMTSLSAAAGVVLGRSANGPQEWKLASGAPIGTLKPRTQEG